MRTVAILHHIFAHRAPARQACQAVAFVLPALQAPGVWEVLVWTDDPHLAASSLRSESQELCRPAEALALLQYRPSLRAAGLTGTGVLAYAPGGERP